VGGPGFWGVTWVAHRAGPWAADPAWGPTSVASTPQSRAALGGFGGVVWGEGASGQPGPAAGTGLSGWVRAHHSSGLAADYSCTAVRHDHNDTMGSTAHRLPAEPRRWRAGGTTRRPLSGGSSTNPPHVRLVSSARSPRRPGWPCRRRASTGRSTHRARRATAAQRRARFAEAVYEGTRPLAPAAVPALPGTSGLRAGRDPAAGRGSRPGCRPSYVDLICRGKAVGGGRLSSARGSADARDTRRQGFSGCYLATATSAGRPAACRRSGRSGSTAATSRRRRPRGRCPRTPGRAARSWRARGAPLFFSPLRSPRPRPPTASPPRSACHDRLVQHRHLLRGEAGGELER